MAHPGTGEKRATIYDAELLEALRRQHRWDPYHLKRLRYGLFRGHEAWDQALQRLPDSVARQLAEAIEVEPLKVARLQRSACDPSIKVLLETGDCQYIELVLMRAFTGRTTVCVSSQVGCDAGCPFCATARLGLRRQLASSEIAEQVRLGAQLARQLGWQVRNIVFMGMGEPLDNEPALHAALSQLTSPAAFAVAPRRIMVSTVGIPSALRRLVDRFPGVQLAISLHSARPELRARLVPWSRRYSWEEVRSAVAYVAQQLSVQPKGGPLMIEYLLLEGVNDSEHDVQALIDYLEGIPACVNLIPYNPVSHAPRWRPTPRSRRDQIARQLRRAGLFTTIRYSMGSDIQAACGQLAGQRPV